jgi:hypothetical protein
MSARLGVTAHRASTGYHTETAKQEAVEIHRNTATP